MASEYRRSSSFLLLGAGLVLSQAIFLAGAILPKFFEITYGSPAQGTMLELMPAPVRFAVAHDWLFAAALGLASVAAITRANRSPSRAFQTTLLGLCAQAAVFWCAMFCFFYDGFCSGMSIHHGPRFDPGAFFRSGFGIFSAALVALVVTVVATLFEGSRTRK